MLLSGKTSRCSKNVREDAYCSFSSPMGMLISDTSVTQTGEKSYISSQDSKIYRPLELCLCTDITLSSKQQCCIQQPASFQ